MAVRLINKEYSTATNLVTATIVTATLENNSKFYNAVIDLGDPDHILPYNGLYECELVVAD